MYIYRLIPILLSLVFFSCSKYELPEGACATCRGKGYMPCQACRGTGYCRHCDVGWMDCGYCSNGKRWDSASDSYVECNYCNGYGERECLYCHGHFLNACYLCQGRGYLKNYVCPDCDGTGRDPNYVEEYNYI